MQISMILQFLFAALLVVYAVYLYHTRLNPKVVRRSALIILLAGTGCYTYALSLEGYASGSLTTIFRSLMLTVKMFIYEGDLNYTHEAQLLPGFLEIYYLIFGAAVITSISAIIMLFGKRAMTLFTLFVRKKKFDHVFIGVNRCSEAIARGIEGEQVAFIEFPSDESEREFSISSVIKGISSGDRDDEVGKRNNIVVLRAKRLLKVVDKTKNVFGVIGLERLKHLIDERTAFYILSEDPDRNLEDLMSLLADEQVSNNTIHVCISRDGVSRYYKTIVKRTGTHFIYPSSLSVVELMKNVKCHPASVMSFVQDADGNRTGAVEGDFNAMVIGFGETGQAVTKFIYEFSSAILVDGNPLPTHITVIDNNMDKLKGQFVFDNPDMDESGIISWESAGTETGVFWNQIIKSLDTLNYIAISMGNDASNLDLACTILMYAMKKRHTGFDNLKIVVRKECTLPHERQLVEKLNEKVGSEVIVCYGEYDKVFTTDMIVSKQKNGINRAATAIAGRISDIYTDISGKTVELGVRSESFHVKNRARMEMHQFISRANHVPSVMLFTGGQREVSSLVLENMAKVEHLRYSRYLIAHGYSYSSEDDDVFKTNHQICRWDGLTEEDRQYHRDMAQAKMLVE